MATDSDRQPMPWHCLNAEQVTSHLGSNLQKGLSVKTARSLLHQLGPNALQEAGRRSLLAMLATQFTDFMILVLIAAAVIAGVIGEPQDTIAIVVIVFLNGIIGFVQEYRRPALSATANPALSMRLTLCLVISWKWKRAILCQPTCA
jgi:Ca2+-transporting ATPase